jgi:hypothetical protein
MRSRCPPGRARIITVTILVAIGPIGVPADRQAAFIVLTLHPMTLNHVTTAMGGSAATASRAAALITTT